MKTECANKTPVQAIDTVSHRICFMIYVCFLKIEYLNRTLVRRLNDSLIKFSCRDSNFFLTYYVSFVEIQWYRKGYCF